MLLKQAANSTTRSARPAAAMGRALVDRLNASGMKLFVIEVGGEFNY